MLRVQWQAVEPVLLPELAAQKIASCQAIDVSMMVSRQVKICQCIIRSDASVRGEGGTSSVSLLRIRPAAL